MATIEQITQTGIGPEGTGKFSTAQFSSAFQGSEGRAPSQAELTEFTETRSRLRGAATPAAPVTPAAPAEVTEVKETVTAKPATPADAKPAAPTAAPELSARAQQEQAMIQELDAFNKAENESIMAELNRMKATSDALTAGTIKQIEDTFNRRVAQQEILNRARLGGVQKGLFRAGVARFAPVVGEGIISAEEKAGVAALANLESEKQSLIIQAQTAASERDFELFAKRTEQLRKNFERRQQAQKDLLGVMDKEEERRASAVEAAREAERFEMEKLEFTQINEDRIAGSLASSFVELDENFNVLSASEEEIATAAEDAGINPQILIRDVNARIDELNEVSRDERNNVLDRQLKQAELNLVELDIAERQAERDAVDLVSTAPFNATFNIGETIDSSSLPNLPGKIISDSEATKLGLPLGITQGQANFIIAGRPGNIRFQELESKEYDNAAGWFDLVDKIETMRNLKGKVDTGPLAAKVKRAARFAGSEDEDFNQLEILSGRQLAEFIKSISGAAVSEQEAQRLAKLVPNIEMQDKQFLNAVDILEEEVQNSIQSAANKFNFTDAEEFRNGVMGTVGREGFFVESLPTFTSEEQVINFQKDPRIIEEYRSIKQGNPGASSGQLLQIFNARLEGTKINPSLQSVEVVEEQISEKPLGQLSNGRTELKGMGQGIVTGIDGSPFWKAGLDFVLKGGFGAPVKFPFGATIIDAVSGFANNSGRPLAKADGKKQNGGFGNQVKVRLPNGIEMWISHLKDVAVRRGDQIRPGQIVGTMGNTGMTLGRTGTHLDITAKKPDGKLFTARQVAALLGDNRLT